MKVELGEVVQWLQVCTAFQKDPSLIPKINVLLLIADYQFGSRGI